MGKACMVKNYYMVILLWMSIVYGEFGIPMGSCGLNSVCLLWFEWLMFIVDVLLPIVILFLVKLGMN